MGVLLYAPLVENNIYFGIGKWVPQTIRGGGWPDTSTSNLDSLHLVVSENSTKAIIVDARGFLPGTSIDANSIEVVVQPLPFGTYMSFLIAPTVTINSANYVTISFTMGNKAGEVVGALHEATVKVNDNQGTLGQFQFYYYKAAP